ncbi:MAG: ATPase, T2SS/T4P/T4SS family [Bacillota bacterium]
MVNAPGKNIVTVEDPVEYIIPGVNHTQVNTKAGLNFATVIRHILRQDPDVIMVGEIQRRGDRRDGFPRGPHRPPWF